MTEKACGCAGPVLAENVHPFQYRTHSPGNGLSTRRTNRYHFPPNHLPPRMHLVIASRIEPTLPLSRLRARGQLIELRAADLRFTSS